MVGVFRRSLSFNPSRPSTARPPISHHTRSISLPSRSHPLISLLRDKSSEIAQTWSSDSNKPSSRDYSSWLVEGLCRLKDLHDCLDDALQLPQSQEALRHNSSAAVEKLLEDFLRLVDAYGIFRNLILSLREEQSAADVAIRRRDELTVSAYVKAGRRTAKEMKGLASAVRCVGGENARPKSAVVSVGDREIVDLIGDVVEATVAVSMAVFEGIALSLVGATRESFFPAIMKKKKKTEKVIGNDGVMREFAAEYLGGLRKKSDGEIREASKKMRELESCVGLIESGGERVFRGLISARVSLLNAFTH